MKKNTRKNIAVISLCIATAILLIGFNLYRERQKQQSLARANHLRLVVDDYFKSKSVSIFPPFSPRDFAATVAFQESYREKATRAIEQCTNVSPLASQITSHYRQFKCSLFENGISKMVGMGKTDSAITDELMNAHELCFFSSEDRARFRLPSSFYWNDRWKAVMIQMTGWPQTVFAGMLLHELGHGYYSTVLKRESAHAPGDSTLWAEEEIIMHELEAAVFNELSKGEYYRICDRVLSKAKGSEVPEIFAGLEHVDLQELDRSLGAEVVSQEIANLLLAEHLIAICCRYVDTHHLGLDAKIKAYRRLASGKL